MIKILYFARLRELLGLSAEEVLLNQPQISVAELIVELIARGPDWQVLASDKNIRVAINQALVSAQAMIKAGDEVAFFPPVTGG